MFMDLEDYEKKVLQEIEDKKEKKKLSLELALKKEKEDKETKDLEEYERLTKKFGGN